MASSSLARERLARRFELWDNDDDGQIELTDYLDEAREILRQFGEPEHSARAQALMGAYAGMWEHIAEQAGVGPDGRIDQQTYVETVERTVIDRGNQGFAEVVRPTIRAIVDMLDTDGDGQVSPAEWQRWANAIGLSPQQAMEAFASVDKDGSGLLTVEELVNAVHDYHEGRSDINLLGR